MIRLAGRYSKGWGASVIAGEEDELLWMVPMVITELHWKLESWTQRELRFRAWSA